MEILPSDGATDKNNDAHQLNLDPVYRQPAKWLHSKDPTGGLLATVMYMDSVEDWVIERLALENPEQREEVRVRQRRLSEIISQYRADVPPDNHAFLQLQSWMNTSEFFYTLDFLAVYQPEFVTQFVAFVMSIRESDVGAALALERIRCVFRARLADRIYSPEIFDFVFEVLMEDAAK